MASDGIKAIKVNTKAAQVSKSWAVSRALPVALYKEMVADPEAFLRVYVDQLLEDVPGANVIEIRVSTVTW